MAPPVVFTDANVLYGATLRDLLLQLGTDKVLSLKWSETVHLEWTQALVRSRPDLAGRVDRTLSLMLAALPDAMVRGHEHLIDELNLPDGNDRHVLAAALECGAHMILTFNVRDFPREALPAGIAAVHPDVLLSLLVGASPVPVLAAVRKVRGRLVKPPMTAGEYVDALRQAALPLTAKAVEAFQGEI
jgi:hypothetical protein